MRPAFAFLLAGLLVQPSITAQTLLHPEQSYGYAGMEGLGDSKLKPAPVTGPALCPVGLRAQHLADGNTVKTSAPVSHGIGQRLHLTLTGKPGRRIVSAKILVRGWTPQGRFQQASSIRKQGGSDNGIRTLIAQFTAGEKDTATAEIWVPELSAVNSVEVLSISYADGSTWLLGKDQACRVAPDPLMLVADR